MSEPELRPRRCFNQRSGARTTEPGSAIARTVRWDRVRAFRVRLIVFSVLFGGLGLLLVGLGVPLFASIGLHGRYWNLGPSVLALSLGGYLVVQAFEGLALERRLRHGGELPEKIRRRMPEHPDPGWVWGPTYAWLATFLVVTVLVMTQGAPVVWLLAMMLSGLVLSAFTNSSPLGGAPPPAIVQRAVQPLSGRPSGGDSSGCVCSCPHRWGRCFGVSSLAVRHATTVERRARWCTVGVGPAGIEPATEGS